MVEKNKMTRPLVPVNPEGLDEVARALLEGSQPQLSQPAIISPLNIIKSDYIQVPEFNLLISKEELHRGKNWNDSHYALADNGLYMSTPAKFIRHFMNVLEANEGKRKLYDGNNKELSKAEVEDLYKYFTTGHRNGAWIWLDAFFKDRKIETNHRVKISAGKKELVSNVSPLESCLKEDCFVDLNFNTQGLAIKKSSSQKYEQGRNIYFINPKNNTVAWFYADSGRASLYCSRDATNSVSQLGVLGCAEGAQKI